MSHGIGRPENTLHGAALSETVRRSRALHELIDEIVTSGNAIGRVASLRMAYDRGDIQSQAHRDLFNLTTLTDCCPERQTDGARLQCVLPTGHSGDCCFDYWDAAFGYGVGDAQ